MVHSAGQKKGDLMRDVDFTTISGREVRNVYTSDDVAAEDMNGNLSVPGEYPYTRGIHPTMYRGKLWTMRQFAGMGTASQTNERFKFLLGKGETGLSTAFDNPTLYGWDSD